MNASVEFKVGDRVQRQGEEGSDCPIGVIRAMHGTSAGSYVKVSFSGLNAFWRPAEGLVPCVEPDTELPIVLPIEPPTLLELIDRYAQRISARDVCAGDTRDVIARRLELIQGYGGTEASNIKAILRTGRPLDGWISDPPQHPEGTPEHTAYATELRTELKKFAKGEEPYPYLPDATESKHCTVCGHPVELHPRYDGDPNRWPKYRHTDRDALIQSGIKAHRAAVA